MVQQFLMHPDTKIGCCLYQNTNFDFASTILEYICMRINDKRKFIYFSRFLHLIFVHLCPESVFQGDTCIKVHKNGPRSFVDMTNKDVKNQFNTPIVCLWHFFKQECLTNMVLGFRIQL